MMLRVFSNSSSVMTRGGARRMLQNKHEVSGMLSRRINAAASTHMLT